MANGIEFCAGCKHGQPFEKSGTNPSFLHVKYSGLGRIFSRYFGMSVNRVEVRDEDMIPRAEIRVPDLVLEQPGPVVKDAVRACQNPIGRQCGAEAALAAKGEELQRLLTEPSSQPAQD